MITFEQFSKSYIYVNEKKGFCRLTSGFYQRFGKMTLRQAYESELVRWAEVKERHAKIEKFEQFLLSIGCQRIQSNVSESRYYHYNGVKYRFSSHFYPTGSMTQRYQDGTYSVIDLTADPDLINEIEY